MGMWGGRRLARWLCGLGAVWGALLLACEPVPEEAAEGALAETGATLSSGAGAVSAGFPVNPAVLRTLETLAQERLPAGPAVAFDGEQYLVVWSDARREVPNLFGARVRKDGTLLDPLGFIIAELLPESRVLIQGGSPAVAFDGTRFIVLWQGREDSRELFATRVTRDGRSLDPAGIPLPPILSGVGVTPDIACDGRGTCLVVRKEFSEEDEPPPGEDEVLGGVLLRDGAVVGDAFRIGGRDSLPRNQAVAWSGREFLVVWQDQRSGGGEDDIFGARVTREGSVVDPDGFPISTAPGAQTAPDVAWTGSRFLVVWEDSRAGERDIFGARVTREGTVVDPDGFPISTAPTEQTQVRIASGGGTTLVVWTDLRTGRPRIRGARVEGDDVLDPSGFAVSTAFFAQDTPAVAFGGGRFLVTFAAAQDAARPGAKTVLAVRVDDDGDTLDSPALRVLRGTPAQRLPAAAFGGGNYLVAWQDFRDDEGPHIRVTRVRPDGTVLDKNGLRLPSAPGAAGPVVASDGRDFLVVWREPGEAEGETLIRAARVGGSGTLRDATALELGTSTGLEPRLAVAFGGGRYLAVWPGSEPGSPPFSPQHIRGARVARDGTVLDPGGFLLSPFGPGEQTTPAVAFVGGRFLVVYRDSFTTFPFFINRILGTRVTLEGIVVDPEGFLVVERSGFEFSPAIASSGTQALVVWTDSTSVEVDLFGSRVTADATVLDPDGFPISTAPGNQLLPTVTFDGLRYRVAWEDDHERRQDIFGARVLTDGTVLDPEGEPIATEPLDEELTPALASDGRGGVAVFYSRFTRGPLLNFRVRGRFLE
ncbi:hypothetical protein BO221_21655 [Archangium sp. Cb G35]|uniref:hypothetical protein n=1 Tax=Archangium sp. Cb G35 TaxID=1920190 RepID=UPI000937E572|nr:hypothetical protein [Archangium sp. Cb G35]OJT22395.1 hypothetical protein BO221_21655 [Archangium sp. Cb G35]